MEELVSVVKDAETGQRGYLLTRDSIFLEPYMVAASKINKKLHMCKTLTKDNLKKRNNHDSLYILINERFEILEATIQKGTGEYELSDVDKSFLLSGKAVMDQIRDKTAAIIQGEKLKLKRRQEEHARKAQIAPITLLYTAFFSLLVFVVAFYKIYKDIKQLRKVNNDLMISERLSEHSEKISNICNWFWFLETNKLSFNKNIYNMLCCNLEDFDHSIEGFNKFVHPEDKHIISEGAERALNEHESATVYYRVIRKDNEIRYFKSVSTIIKDALENTVMIGVITDITEFRRNSILLEQKLLDLERTNIDLMAFNHVASHDLQEPLRKIETFISRIEGKEASDLSTNGKNYFSRIKLAAARMRKLIDDLLTFSRTNKDDEIYELIDLNAFMENAIRDLFVLIDEKQAIINTSILPTLNVIPFQIQQLFTNLIENALKYSKKDFQPIITISSEIIFGKEEINESFTSENRLLQICFSDNGIGFEQEHSDEIFKLFNRLHSKNEYSGNGIGLAICKKVVENHKGFINAVSVPNVGSKFTVFLPMVIDEEF